MTDKFRTRSYDAPATLNMLTVRNILVALICASPINLAWDGLIAQGVVAGIVAAALAITARKLRAGETEFLVSTIRIPMVAAAVPTAWMLLQVLPLWGACPPDSDKRRESTRTPSSWRH